MKPELIKDFNLPNYVKGKSFAEASKAIEKKFSERTDVAAKETKEELMGRLAKAQEYVKMQESLKSNSQEVPDTMNGQVPKGFEEFAPQNQMMGGGMIGEGLEEGATGQAQGNAIGGMAGIAGHALQSANLMFGDTGVDESGIGGRQERVSGAGMAATGALSGAAAGSAAGPIGAAVGAVVGGVSGAIGGSRKNKSILEANQNAGLIENNQFTNDFAHGGFHTDPTDPKKSAYGPQQYTAYNDWINQVGVMNMPYNPNATDKLNNVMSKAGVKSVPVRSKENTTEVKATTGLGSKNIFDAYPIPAMGTPREEVNSVNALPESSINTTDPLAKHKNPKIANNKFTGEVPKSAGIHERAGNWLGENYGDILRTAPALANAFQLANMKKPQKESLDRIISRYKTNHVDEKALENRIQSEGNNVSNALASASNGSAGALRANLLGASLNKTKATNDAFLKADDINRQEDRAAQQFNSRNDMINLRQSNREKENFARDKGAYESNKSALISQLGNDIGNFGKESTNKKQVAELFGYTWDGEYVVDKQGKRKHWKEFQKEVREYEKKNKNE